VLGKEKDRPNWVNLSEGSNSATTRPLRRQQDRSGGNKTVPVATNWINRSEGSDSAVR